MSEELKEMLRNAKSAEEAKHIVDTDKQALEDKDLSKVAGGYDWKETEYTDCVYTKSPANLQIC